jgi:hypothetical protein
MKNVIETPTVNDPCIGNFVTSIIWVRADLDMIARDAQSKVVSSCLLGRKLTEELKSEGGKLSLSFEDASGKHVLVYDNSQPENGFVVN